MYQAGWSLITVFDFGTETCPRRHWWADKIKSMIRRAKWPDSGQIRAKLMRHLIPLFLEFFLIKLESLKSSLSLSFILEQKLAKEMWCVNELPIRPQLGQDIFHQFQIRYWFISTWQGFCKTFMDVWPMCKRICIDMTVKENCQIIHSDSLLQGTATVSVFYVTFNHQPKKINFFREKILIIDQSHPTSFKIFFLFKVEQKLKPALKLRTRHPISAPVVGSAQMDFKTRSNYGKWHSEKKSR